MMDIENNNEVLESSTLSQPINTGTLGQFSSSVDRAASSFRQMVFSFPGLHFQSPAIFHRPEEVDELGDFDFLRALNPRANEAIKAIRAEGYESHEIAEFMGSFEQLARDEGYSQYEINEFFGRQPQTIRHIEGLLNQQKLEMYEKALAGVMDTEEIRRRFEIADLMDVKVSNLFFGIYSTEERQQTLSPEDKKFIGIYDQGMIDEAIRKRNAFVQEALENDKLYYATVEMFELWGRGMAEVGRWMLENVPGAEALTEYVAEPFLVPIVETLAIPATSGFLFDIPANLAKASEGVARLVGASTVGDMLSGTSRNINRFSQTFYELATQGTEGNIIQQSVRGAGSIAGYVAMPMPALTATGIIALSGNQEARDRIYAKHRQRGMSHEEAYASANSIMPNLADYAMRLAGSFIAMRLLKSGVSVESRISPYFQKMFQIAGAALASGVRTTGTESLTQYRADEDIDWQGNFVAGALNGAMTAGFGVFNTIFQVGDLKTVRNKWDMIRRFDPIHKEFGMHSSHAKGSTIEMFTLELNDKLIHGEMTRTQAANYMIRLGVSRQNMERLFKWVDELEGTTRTARATQAAAAPMLAPSSSITTPAPMPIPVPPPTAPAATPATTPVESVIGTSAANANAPNAPLESLIPASGGSVASVNDAIAATLERIERLRSYAPVMDEVLDMIKALPETTTLSIPERIEPPTIPLELPLMGAGELSLDELRLQLRNKELMGIPSSDTRQEIALREAEGERVLLPAPTSPETALLNAIQDAGGTLNANYSLLIVRGDMRSREPP